MLKTPGLTLLLSAALGLGAISCADNTDEAGMPANQPGASSSWTETSRRVRCGADETGVCTGGKLVVSRSGQFFFVNTTHRGQLTESEQADLVSAGDALTGSLDEAPRCTGSGAAPEVATEVVTLSPEQGSEVTVLEFNRNDGRSCFIGTEASVERLRSTLATLMEKYAPPQNGYDPCAGKLCGDRCTLCSPSDPDCVETAVLKFCNRSGDCVAGEPACE